MFKFYLKQVWGLIFLVIAWLFWLIYGSLVYTWLLTTLNIKEKDVMPYFKMVFPTILFVLAFFSGFKMGRVHEKNNSNQEQKTPYDCFLYFLNKRYGNADVLSKYGMLDATNIIKWYTNTLAGIELAYGDNISNNRDIMASLAVIKSRIDCLPGYNLTRNQLLGIITQCRDQLIVIKQFTRPQSLSNFNPLDLKRYE